MTDREARELIREWQRCQAVEITVVELSAIRDKWRAVLRTTLGRQTIEIGSAPAAAMRGARKHLGYIVRDGLSYVGDDARRAPRRREIDRELGKWHRVDRAVKAAS